MNKKICLLTLLILLVITPRIYGEKMAIGHECHEEDRAVDSSASINAKELSLRIAKELENLIQRNSTDTVVHLRPDNKSVPLEALLKEINGSGADLFICISVNRSKENPRRGYEVYRAAMGLNNKENVTTDNSKELNFIVNDLKKDLIERNAKSAELSKQLFKQLSQFGFYSQQNGPLSYPDDLLLGVNVPAVKVVIYIGHQKDKQLFGDPSQIRAFAQALYTGLMNYMRVEGYK